MPPYTFADWPIPRLTDVVPAKHPWLITTSEVFVRWLGQDDSRWEAEYEPDHGDDLWHVWCESDEYGLDEEDYMVVKSDDLLDIVANGAGKCRRTDRPIITSEG